MQIFTGDISVILLIIAVLFTLTVFLRRTPLLASYEKLPEDDAGLFCPRGRYPVSRRDILLIIAISIIYGAVAFFGLGNKASPQSFAELKSGDAPITITFAEPESIDHIEYFCGVRVGDYNLSFSIDGESWFGNATLEQSYTKIFKWQSVTPDTILAGIKYIRLSVVDTVRRGDAVDLGELALFDVAGQLIPAKAFTVSPGGDGLFDEQGLVPPEGESYLNSTYFDEIYHARTAEENIQGIYPYEVSHPPLGKLIISVGIHLFGLTPFGWRFMGTLFGVAMLAFLYIFLKNMFGNTAVSACGTLLFAFDFMHFTQTRIATIDTYGVFFILGMYFFMYRFISIDPDDPLIPKRRRYIPLMLSGIFFGVGAACKWTVIYGGAGLLLIWLLYWINRAIALVRADRGRELIDGFIDNAALCIAFFVVVPAAIYYISYLPYGLARGMSGLSMIFKKEYFDIVWGNQKFMLEYHSKMVLYATHPYSSRWYQWLFDGRPILYYLRTTAPGVKSAFGAFTAPLLTWGGLICMIFLIYLAAFKRDGKSLFILIGYLSQLIPWLPIARLTFAYHYFPCVIFLTLAVCRFFDVIRKQSEDWRSSLYAFTGISLLLFALFYPALSGLPVPDWYGRVFLDWIPSSWPF